MAAAPAAAGSTDEIFRLVGEVPDPEVPVLTIADLGVLRSVDTNADGSIVVSITPTYSGCPAMDTIATDIAEVLAGNDIDGTVEIVWSPAWTTDWMSDEGRDKLRAYGIAPPDPQAHAGHRPGGDGTRVEITPRVACPQCGSHDTEPISEFGSTACKALYRCLGCAEPFDYFKAH